VKNFDRIFGAYNEKIDVTLERLKKKMSYSYASRKTKVFYDYAAFSSEHYREINASNLLSSFVHFRDFCFREQKKSISSINDDMRALRRVLRLLMLTSALPRVSLPPNLKINADLIRNIETNPVLGLLNPKKWREDLAQKSLPIIQNIDDKDYLKIFIEHIRQNRNLLLSIARDYVHRAYIKFQDGKSYIDSVDTSIFENLNLLDHSQAERRGQLPSIFSPKLPNNKGLKNLVAYLSFNHQGLLSNQFPGANNHLYNFEGRTNLSEYLGISSNVASACAIIIAIETGINPESLYRLKIKDSRDNTTFFIPLDSDGETFQLTYNKPRARRNITKLLKASSDRINTQFCLMYIQEATKNHRTLIKKDCANFVFIHDSTYRQSKIHTVSATAFKDGLKRILKLALENKSFSNQQDSIAILINTQPNLAKVRKTEGILRWFDSGGDPRAAARYLGNTTQVAIKNYLPPELQAMLYTKQIRAFQHILIAVATEKTSYQQHALGLHSPEELFEFLEQLSQLDLAWSMLGKAASEISANPRQRTQYTVVLTESNVALLYAAYTTYNRALADGSISLEKHKKWASVAISLFNKIRLSGTRVQKLQMERGIALYHQAPLEFKL